MFLEKFLAQFTWLDWVGLIWFITSGILSVRDIDFMGRMGPAPLGQVD